KGVKKTNVTTGDDFEKPTKMPVKGAMKEDEAENEPNRKAKKEKTIEEPSSQPVEYYLKHKINEKLTEGLVGNHRKKITRKEDIGGNFEIPCNIRVMKHMNALVDQGSDVNVMPLSTYMKLTDERLAETNIRLPLASHSYIYPLGIDEDVLVEVAEHVYPMDFVILDIKEDEKRPFILGTPFLTTAKAVIKFDKGTITLRSGKSKISFHMIPELLCKIERGVKNDIYPIAPTMTVNRLVLEWEERIKLYLERKMEFDQWKSKNFKGKHHTLFKVEGGLMMKEKSRKDVFNSTALKFYNALKFKLQGKVAGGNGEQVLSRDIYRLGQLFDFFQMLSFFFTTVGYYFCTMLTVITVYIFVMEPELPLEHYIIINTVKGSQKHHT
nr:hypothetical protein [Tanacetum cinerariifolium]